MSDFMNTSTDTTIQLFFMISNRGQRLFVLNEDIYRCNNKTVRKNIGNTMTVHTDEKNLYLCGGKGDYDHQPNSDLI